ncbi:unnamed protein product [Amoebophrya sp. A25]|nr:unnamed protein product [Amoebophrya sp. A25]|eukprot:GSA25T00016893001.1
MHSASASQVGTTTKARTRKLRLSTKGILRMRSPASSFINIDKIITYLQRLRLLQMILLHSCLCAFAFASKNVTTRSYTYPTAPNLFLQPVYVSASGDTAPVVEELPVGVVLSAPFETTTSSSSRTSSSKSITTRNYDEDDDEQKNSGVVASATAFLDVKRTSLSSATDQEPQPQLLQQQERGRGHYKYNFPITIKPPNAAGVTSTSAAQFLRQDPCYNFCDVVRGDKTSGGPVCQARENAQDGDGNEFCKANCRPLFPHVEIVGVRKTTSTSLIQMQPSTSSSNKCASALIWSREDEVKTGTAVGKGHYAYIADLPYLGPRDHRVDTAIATVTFEDQQQQQQKQQHQQKQKQQSSLAITPTVEAASARSSLHKQKEAASPSNPPHTPSSTATGGTTAVSVKSNNIDNEQPRQGEQEKVPPPPSSHIVVKSQLVFPLFGITSRPIQLPWRVLNEINILENLPPHPHVVSLLGTRIGFGTGVPMPGEGDRTRSTQWEPVSSSFSTMKLPERYPSSAKDFSRDEINQVPHVHTLMPKLPGGTLSDRIKAPATDTPHPVLLDFGMASIGENSDNGNDIVVEAYYRPPELRTVASSLAHMKEMQRQRYSTRVDIWSVCFLFTRMLEMLFVLSPEVYPAATKGNDPYLQFVAPPAQPRLEELRSMNNIEDGDVLESDSQTSFKLLGGLESSWLAPPATDRPSAGPFFFEANGLFHFFHEGDDELRNPRSGTEWDDGICRVAHWLSVEKDEVHEFTDKNSERERCDAVCKLTPKAKEHLEDIWNTVSKIADITSDTLGESAPNDDAPIMPVEATEPMATNAHKPDSKTKKRPFYLHTHSGLSRVISAYDGVSNLQILGVPVQYWKKANSDKTVKNPFFTGETATALYNFLRGGLRCHPDDRENIRDLIRLFNVLIDTYAGNEKENHANNPARKEQILALKIPEKDLELSDPQQAINEKTKAKMKKAVQEYQKARTDVENLSDDAQLEQARTAMKGAVSHELQARTTALFTTAVKKVEDQVYKKGMEILYNIVRRSEIGEAEETAESETQTQTETPGKEDE